jgi:hypothetical protein
MVATGRKLNDYECLLATSTCNVGLLVSLPTWYTSQAIKSAWGRCVVSHDLLQVRLIVKDKDDVGILGNARYHAVPLDDTCDDVHTTSLVQVIEDNNLPAQTRSSRFELLKTLSGNVLKIGEGSYAAKGWLSPSATDGTKKELFVVLSLTHALSDGPGALQVAHSFLQHLVDPSNTPTAGQPLIDLQCRLLGDDYGATLARNDNVYQELRSYQTKLVSQPTNDAPILPPEALQGIPKGLIESAATGCINAIHIELSSSDTTDLIQSCRSMGATVQGAISVATVVARLKALQIECDKPIECSIQVPVNTRVFASDFSTEEFSKTCVCGSAGVVHSLEVDTQRLIPQMYIHQAFDNLYHKDEERPQQSELVNITNVIGYFLKLCKECTDKLKTAIGEKQPSEWLRRLMNDPASMPPYSVMASSVGVSPVLARYTHNNEQDTIHVKECHFFGSSLQTSKEAQGTMIHAVTFDGRMQIMMNFTSPGIQDKPFMEIVAREMEATLKLIAQGHDSRTKTLDLESG